MDGRLAGKVALVTGGTRGIGEAIATAMVQEGATVIIASRKQPNVDEAIERIERVTELEVTGTTLHIGDTDRCEEVVQAIFDEHGKLDVLVNNAATNPYFGPMIGIDWPAWDKTFEVNLKGAFALTKATATRLMAIEHPGSIVNVSSIMGMRAARFQGVYGMTKAAIISMTQTLAMELGGAGIRVNAIAPGLVRTKFASTLTDSPEIADVFTSRTAMQRVAEPDEIAGMAIYLASDEASYVSGQTFAVDGGYTIA